MANLYFDESIRESGRFIVGALVVSDKDLSRMVREKWVEMGYDPDTFEYKSSAPKSNNAESRRHRSAIRGLLQYCGLGLVICPFSDRGNLGVHCVSLVSQLLNIRQISTGRHELFIDQNISIPKERIDSLASVGVTVHLNQDSRVIAGLQVSDHAAHALGGMLLEELGIVRKTVFAGENSGYDPDLQIELGFELWAGLRYALFGNNEHIPGLSPPPEDPANPYFRVEGYGMFIAQSCSEELAQHARNRFGVNYLGCIH